MNLTDLLPTLLSRAMYAMHIAHAVWDKETAQMPSFQLTSLTNRG